jgi:hypothetical protein
MSAAIALHRARWQQEKILQHFRFRFPFWFLLGVLKSIEGAGWLDRSRCAAFAYPALLTGSNIAANAQTARDAMSWEESGSWLRAAHGIRREAALLCLGYSAAAAASKRREHAARSCWRASGCRTIPARHELSILQRAC